ncbi:MAG: aminotransferase class V-fold PLP-dependent enzyme, partial [Lysobacterales bacterium]
MVVREWRVDPRSGDLNVDALDQLLGERTKLVCFPHVSNIVGSVNDVNAITAKAHAVGAMVCVDGVAAVAHHLPDVKALGVDFYLFSVYKMYG